MVELSRCACSCFYVVSRHFEVVEAITPTERLCLVHAFLQVVSKLLVQQRKEEKDREEEKEKKGSKSDGAPNKSSAAAVANTVSASPPASKHRGRARLASPPPSTERIQSASSSPVIPNEARVRGCQVASATTLGDLLHQKFDLATLCLVQITDRPYVANTVVWKRLGCMRIKPSMFLTVISPAGRRERRGEAGAGVRGGGNQGEDV